MNGYDQCEAVHLILGDAGREWTNREISQIAHDLGWPGVKINASVVADAIRNANGSYFQEKLW